MATLRLGDTAPDFAQDSTRIFSMKFAITTLMATVVMATSGLAVAQQTLPIRPFQAQIK